MVFSALFAIIVGLGMIGQWAASYRSGQIPELVDEPIRIGFHIVAEMITAVALIIGGVGLLLRQSWANPLYLVAVGMLFYTAVVSPGYFAQKGQWTWLIIFTVLIILGLVSISFII